MKQRGRKSAEALTAVADVSAKRPGPPSGLTPEQATVWVNVVGCYPATYFRPAERDLLALFCKHVVEAWRLSALAETIPEAKIKTDGLDTYLKVLAARDRETKAATSLARSMRITHQSRTHKDKAGRLAEQGADKALWEE